MNEKEVNDYLDGLITGKIRPKERLEARLLDLLATTNNAIVRQQSSLQRLQFEAKQLQQKIDRNIGKQEAYANELVQIEIERRAAPKSKLCQQNPPISLEELAKKTGADRVEAVDTEGKIVDSANSDAKSDCPDVFKVADLTKTQKINPLKNK